jgi:menaquinone-dependent protoporphyrinogen oxidase
MHTDPVELPLLRDATGFREHKILPGKLVPKTLPFAQRTSLLVFRGLAGDFRDWTEVRQWADSIAGQLTAVAPGG